MSAGFAERVLVMPLEGGQRLRLRHGPIDLVLAADGPSRAVRRAHQRAVRAFEPLLETLASELPLLRREVCSASRNPTGPVARTMMEAARIFHEQHRVTPMICVAGAVASFILDAMTRERDLNRAYVNNGGDIALYLSDRSDLGCGYDIGICTDPRAGTVKSRARIDASSRVRGVATSGWRGRSHSLGIADAVTVLAEDAPTADAAASLIANAVDLPAHRAIRRERARDLSPDSDLGDRLVTVDVGPLTRADRLRALSAGRLQAHEMLAKTSVRAVFASLQGTTFELSTEAHRLSLSNRCSNAALIDAGARMLVHDALPAVAH